MTNQPKLNAHKRIQSWINRKVEAGVAEKLAAMPQPLPPEPADPPKPRGPGTNAITENERIIAANKRAEQQAAAIDTIRVARAAGAPTPAQMRQAEADATVAAVIEKGKAKKAATPEGGSIDERRHAHVERTRNGTTPQPLTTAPTSGIAPFRQRSFDAAAQKASAAAEQRKQRAIDIENTLRDHRAQR